MLYKKIHRQFVRQFRVGRRYWHHDIYEITKKPRINCRGTCILVDGGWPVIYIAGSRCSGKIQYKGAFGWIDED